MKLGCALLTLCAAAPALALEPTRPLAGTAVASWSEGSGLPHHTVQALAQTPDGYLWVGTLEGLARFDGAEFRTFDRANTPALARNDVESLHVARDGSLWIATYGGGLVRHRDGAFEAVTLPGLAPAVTDLAEDREGSLWIGTAHGLQRLKAGRVTTFGTAEGLSHGVVRSVFVDRSDVLWVGTNVGLDRWAGGQVTHFGPADGLPGSLVRAIGEDAEGRIWAGTDRGAVRRDGDRFVAPAGLGEAARESVAGFLLDRRGAFWVLTDRRLARRGASGVEVLTGERDLPGNGLNAVLEDHEGSLWIGGGRGLAQVQDGALFSTSRLQGLSSDSILTVAPGRDGGLWLGSSEGHIDRLAGGRVTSLKREGNSSRVLALLEDDRRRLWAGTDTGLQVLESGAWRSVGPGQGLPAGPIRSLLQDRRGTVWVGTDGAGLARLDGQRFRTLTTADGLPSDQIRALLEGRDGALLVATYGGLASVVDGRVAEPAGADGLRGRLLRSLHEDERGVLWIGAYGSGLYRLESGRLSSIGSREGLANDVVYAIVDDGAGRLWMSSNKGLSAVPRRELDEFAAGRLPRIRPLTFGRGDGMRSSECNGGSPAGWKDADGHLWFATEGGVAAVDPAAALQPRPLPPPRIEEIEVDGQPVPGLPVVLAPEARRIRVWFRSPSFRSPERTRFSFRLEGFDSEWVEALRRTATYTRLPPGEYSLRVRASRSGGPWVEAPEPLQIRVRAHWYRRPGVQLGLLALAVAAAGLAYRIRVLRLEARQQELKERVEEAVARLKVLQGLLPICSTCKKIRDGKGEWSRLEVYIRDHSEAEFTHGICPECMERLYPEQARKIRARQQQG